MKIATLQFSPRLGEVAANFSRAESLIMRQEREGELIGIDLLVLPELAFAGESNKLWNFCAAWEVKETVPACGRIPVTAKKFRPAQPGRVGG